MNWRGPRADDVFVGDARPSAKSITMLLTGTPSALMMSPDACHLQGVAVAMQMPALAGVVRNPVSGVEFEAAGDAHGGSLKRLRSIAPGRPRRSRVFSASALNER